MPTALLRALVVVVAVTLAGTAFPGLAESGTQAASQPAPRHASPTPTPTDASTASPASPGARPSPSPNASPAASPSAGLPLRGVTIALDPGHQLGNARYPDETGRLVPAGGFTKPCNTTGSATDSGVAESTVNWQVALLVRARLESLGATVRMTRTSHSQGLWGPCVDARGRFGARVGARLMVSLHADGAPATARGFHVIAPQSRVPWTSDIAAPSLALATSLRDGLTAAGIPRASYVGQGTGLVVRQDLGTLNMSDVPVVMIEMGNLRNTADARRMTTTSGRTTYATAIVQGIRTYLGR